MPPGTQAKTMSPSSPQEEADAPVPKLPDVVDSQRGGVSDPSDSLSSSCSQVEIISIDPDLVG